MKMSRWKLNSQQTGCGFSLHIFLKVTLTYPLHKIHHMLAFNKQQLAWENAENKGSWLKLWYREDEWNSEKRNSISILIRHLCKFRLVLFSRPQFSHCLYKDIKGGKLHSASSYESLNSSIPLTWVRKPKYICAKKGITKKKKKRWKIKLLCFELQVTNFPAWSNFSI